MTERFFLDVLPRHPAMRPLETFTSYVRFLAHLNGFTSIDSIANSFFPRMDRRVARGITDFGAIQLDDFALRSAQSIERLIGTTLQPIASNFGRSTHPQALSRFLNDLLTDHVQLCPQCLCERLYYRLTWRFKHLKSCVHHRCILLNKCGNCNSPLALYSTPISLGTCPSCGFDQRNSLSSPTSDTELDAAKATTHTIEFLLSPIPDSLMGSDLGRLSGIGLAKLRREHGLTIQIASNKSGLSRSVIEAIERNNIASYGAKLGDYLVYANFFGTTLEKAVLLAQQDLPQVRSRDEYDEELYEAATIIIHELEAGGARVLQSTVASLLGVSPGTLRNYPRVANLLSEAVQRREKYEQRRREDVLVDHAKVAIKVLEDGGQKLSLRRVARELGMHHTSLRPYSRVRDLIVGKS